MSLSAFQDIDFTAEKLSSSSDQSSEPSGEKVDLKVQEKKKLDEIQAIQIFQSFDLDSPERTKAGEQMRNKPSATGIDGSDKLAEQQRYIQELEQQLQAQKEAAEFQKVINQKLMEEAKIHQEDRVKQLRTDEEV